ncbi:hypothetical protein R3I93_004486 [Phoxinus phoxinus]|uniref:non-specific serine/threonine protein kinase n=1 Tax=Phoxinus phoxinus TaxID=58324 RepID=A0AAN9HBK5_9TELE
MLQLQKPPTSTHIIHLYEIFVRKDEDILVLEYPHHAMTLFEYVQRNRGSLTEIAVKHIIRQLVVALQHCMHHGIFHDTHIKNILIYPNSLEVKLMDFRGALILPETRADEPILNAAVRKYAEWAVSDDTAGYAGAQNKPMVLANVTFVQRTFLDPLELKSSAGAGEVGDREEASAFVAVTASRPHGPRLLSGGRATGSGVGLATSGACLTGRDGGR